MPKDLEWKFFNGYMQASDLGNDDDYIRYVFLPLFAMWGVVAGRDGLVSDVWLLWKTGL